MGAVLEGHPWCKNLWCFPLFRNCWCSSLHCFSVCSLCFTSVVTFTGFYTEDNPFCNIVVCLWSGKLLLTIFYTKLKQPLMSLLYFLIPQEYLFTVRSLLTLNPLSPNNDLSQLLIAISRVYQLVRSWELSTWSLKFKSIEILTTFPHYFCMKSMETQKENL